jgi:hypothetical protein
MQKLLNVDADSQQTLSKYPKSGMTKFSREQREDRAPIYIMDRLTAAFWQLSYLRIQAPESYLQPKFEKREGKNTA